jgi:mycothiol system anti-sigma-R factor
MIDCREAVHRMWAYLDRSLELRPTEELESHLEACVRCCGELEFSRELRGLVAASSGPALPGDVRDRIEQLLGTGADSGQDR